MGRKKGIANGYYGDSSNNEHLKKRKCHLPSCNIKFKPITRWNIFCRFHRESDEVRFGIDEHAVVFNLDVHV